MNDTVVKKVVAMAGPTTSGESTITREIISRFPDKFTRLVTATTRKPRGDEIDGVDYYFFSEEDFKNKKDSGEIVETTFVPHRNVWYGTYEPDLKKKLDAGYIVIVNLEIAGAKYYKKNYDATTLFITPGSIDEVERRLLFRNPDISGEEVEQRKAHAQEEMKDADFYDYVIENPDGGLNDAVEEIISILKKEGYEF